MNKNTLRYWLALMTIPEFSMTILQKCLDGMCIEAFFEDPGAAKAKMLLSPRLIQKIKNPNWNLVDKLARWLEEPLHHFVCVADAMYPQQLREIASAPIGYFVKGDASLLSCSQIAMVGSRKATRSALLLATEYAIAFAEHGLIVTSGLALGIDGASHQGVVNVGKPTIAVMGTGLDVIYPRRHHKLAEQIIENGGALVSEYPLETAPKPLNFPRRNRIISGLSLGVLVVEATKRSGSLITARFAMEQGREVMALPSSVHNVMAQGCHHLIQQGAKLVYRIEDVLQELVWPMEKQHSIKEPLCSLSIEEQRVYKEVAYEVTELEQIVAISGLAFDEVCSILLALELKGVIYAAPNGYVRAR